MRVRFVVVALVAAACSDPSDHQPSAVSYDVSPVRMAVDRFVKSGRTPSAFAQLTSSIEEMRGSDPVVADDAELRLLALAAPIVERARSRSLADQVDELALTVWPTLLSGPLTGDAQPTPVPTAGESPTQYIARLCATELVAHCGAEEAEVQAITVRAIALRNANERMRVVLARAAEGPEWQRLGFTFESLDNEAAYHRARAGRSERTVVSQGAW